MKINLSPQRRDDSLSASRVGEALTINGETFNFSQVGEGDVLPAEAIASEWFVGPVTRVDGVLALTLVLPLPINFSPEQAFPGPLLLTDDGPIVLPQPLPGPDAEQEVQA